jgi:hypothetical protein
MIPISKLCGDDIYTSIVEIDDHNLKFIDVVGRRNGLSYSVKELNLNPLYREIIPIDNETMRYIDSIPSGLIAVSDGTIRSSAVQNIVARVNSNIRSISFIKRVHRGSTFFFFVTETGVATCPKNDRFLILNTLFSMV